MSASKKEAPNKPAISLWRHPLVILTAVSGLGALVALRAAAKKPDDIALTLLSNLVVFISSGLLSYFITYNNERRQFQSDLAKIADFSRRRVDLLRANLLSLTKEIESIGDISEIKRIVTYTLRNLEQDARASVKDIEDMGGILSPDIIEPASIAPVAESVVSSSITLEETKFNCRMCGQSSSVELSLAPGATKHVHCPHCDARLNAHRLKNGSCKIVVAREHGTSRAFEAPNPERLSNYAAPNRPRREPLGVGSAVVHEQFDCPRCRNTISYTTQSADVVVQKPCFSCFSVCSYDRVSKTALVEPNRKPRYIATIEIPEMECEICQAIFSPQKYKNRDGVELICCFSCNTIYLNKGERKLEIVKLCLTKDCGNEIRFKVSESKSEAKQFCLDCFKRLSYDNRSGEMAIVEELLVPKLTEAEFEERKMECPHCHTPTSGRWTKNHHGNRLSICWNCKGVFELTQIEKPPKPT